MRSSAVESSRHAARALLALGCVLGAFGLAALPAAAFTHVFTARTSEFDGIDGLAVDRNGDILVGTPWLAPTGFNTLPATKVDEFSPAGKPVGFTRFGQILEGTRAGGLYVRGEVAMTPNGRDFFIGGGASPDLSGGSFRPFVAEFRTGSGLFVRGVTLNTGPNNIGGPLAVDSTGENVYVADGATEGAHPFKNGGPNRVYELTVPHLDQVRRFDLHGIAASVNEQVMGIAVGGPDGDVYVQVAPGGGGGSTLVQVYDSDGTFVRQFDAGRDTGGIAVSPTGMIFVGGTHGVDVFRADGGPRSSRLATTRGVDWVAVDSSDDLYVMEFGTTNVRSSIVKFAPLVPQTRLVDPPSPGTWRDFESPTATFRFRSPTAGSTFECRLVRRGFEVGQYEQCASPERFPNTPNGRYRFDVRAVSPDGAPDQTPSSMLVIVDVAYAHAFITSRPPKLIKKASATFAFASSNTPPAARFQCRLTPFFDRGKPFTPCSSPMTYHGLKHDVYTFQVQAITNEGYVQPSATAFTFAARP